jgi:hypothetical protein
VPKTCQLYENVPALTKTRIFSKYCINKKGIGEFHHQSLYAPRAFVVQFLLSADGCPNHSRRKCCTGGSGLTIDAYDQIPPDSPLLKQPETIPAKCPAAV